MMRWLSHLDRLLRGDTTRPDAIRDGNLPLEAGGLAVLIVALGAIYGLCMGSYSMFKEVSPDVVDPNGRVLQLLATTIKVPSLFYLTLLVTFPSLYVFNALVGSRLSLLSVLQLLIASLAVNLAVLSSLGPIVLFFSLSTKSYAFIVLLNVVVFTVAGVLGLMFLLQTMHRLTALFAAAGSTRKSTVDADATDAAAAGDPIENSIPETTAEPTAEEPSALDMPPGQTLGEHTRLVFSCWIVLFALVGAQMGWVLRPFVGNPYEPFTWFRERGSNFFEALLRMLGALFGGGG